MDQSLAKEGFFVHKTWKSRRNTKNWRRRMLREGRWQIWECVGESSHIERWLAAGTRLTRSQMINRSHMGWLISGSYFRRLWMKSEGTGIGILIRSRNSWSRPRLKRGAWLNRHELHGPERLDRSIFVGGRSYPFPAGRLSRNRYRPSRTTQSH